MENNSTPNSEFENYLRKHLQQIDDTPDDEVWANIAGKQAQPNRWQQRRRLLLNATWVVLIVAGIAGLWQFNRNKPAEHGDPFMPQNEQATPAQNPVPMANIPESGTEEAGQAASAKGESKHASIRDFSPRANNVRASVIQFKAETGLSYKSPITGTTVKIPANSLVDEQGNPATGEAELFFREYRSIEEFLAAGMPMHYNDGRGSFSFNSGGMFEVRVSQAGTMLALGQGQGYQVNFTPTNELDQASLYYLNDETGDWEYRPDAAFGQAGMKQPPVVTEETVLKNNLKNQSTDCVPDGGIISGSPDYTEMVKLGVKTGFELATGKLPMPTWFRKNPYLTDDQLLFRMERGLIQLKQHRDQNQLFFPEDLNKFFTELAAFKGCYFTFNVDSLGGAKNLGNLTKGDYWQRITVAQENGANCIITLFDGKEGQLQFHATLAGSTENKNFKAEKVLAEYQRLRKLRQLDFAEKNKALRYFLFASYAFKPKEEWCYSAFEWLEFFEKNHPLMARRYAKLVKDGYDNDNGLAAQAWADWQKILRDRKFDKMEGQSQATFKNAKTALEYSLRLSNFGIYNYDQIFRFGGDGTIYVNTAYKTTDGKKVVPAFVSVMEQRTKAFMTLASSTKIMYSPGRKLDIIVTDKEGRQYLFSREKYANQEFNTSGFTILTVEDVTEKTNSPRAWAELLEI